MKAPDPAHYTWWLASRASGLVALALITASVNIGLLMASKLVRRRGAGARLLRLHEAITLTGLVAIAVHGITLLGDSWLRPGIGGVTVPFVISYRPLFTALGILGAYLAVVLGLSFYFRRRIGARLWRRLHRLTIVAYVLTVVHALGAGTDTSVPWLRSAVVASAVPAAALFVIRIVPRPATARRKAGVRATRVPAREGTG